MKTVYKRSGGEVGDIPFCKPFLFTLTDMLKDREITLQTSLGVGRLSERAVCKRRKVDDTKRLL